MLQKILRRMKYFLKNESISSSLDRLRNFKGSLYFNEMVFIRYQLFIISNGQFCTSLSGGKWLTMSVIVMQLLITERTDLVTTLLEA